MYSSYSIGYSYGKIRSPYSYDDYGAYSVYSDGYVDYYDDYVVGGSYGFALRSPITLTTRIT